MPKHTHKDELLNYNKLLSQCSSNKKDLPKEVFELLKLLINYIAIKKDNEVINKLMKNLIESYSINEKKLFELNQEKNKFLGIAAHDLRNPLTAINGFSELLLSKDFGPTTDSQKEFITVIKQSSNDMLNLVNDLLDISVIESGKLELELKNSSLKTLIEERIRLCDITAKKKDIEIKSDLDKIKNFYFDYRKIAQVVDNLITNAIKFSPSNTKIYVSLVRENNTTKVSVKDEGQGIDENEIKHIFGAFQKLSVQPTAGEKSTGLGLSITKKIINAHKGEIDIKSKPGNGSIFTFYIPMGDDK